MTNDEWTPSDDEEGAAAPGDKLIPEWGLGADNQVVLVGLAVLAILGGLFAWRTWFDGDDVASAVAAEVLGDDGAAGGDGDGDGDGDGAGETAAAAAVGADDTDDDDADGADDTDDGEGEAEESATTTSTTAAPPAGPDEAALLAAATAVPDTDVTAAADGSLVTLTGFVADAEESAAVEEGVRAIDGVDDVDNQLVLLIPQAQQIMDDAGVVAAGALGNGTRIIVNGIIQSEEEREPLLAEVAAIPGVTEVTDELALSVVNDLNDLPQVQFATGSDEILPVSFADLDEAAELINSAGDVEILIIATPTPSATRRRTSISASVGPRRS